LPDTYARWERLGAKAAHVVLYGLIFCLPLSGWIHDSAWKDAATHPMRLFGTFPWPRIGVITTLPADTKESLHTVFRNIHTALAYVLYGLVALHIGGALKHQFLDKERELQRILPWGGKP
jgi:cytochrome b561